MAAPEAAGEAGGLVASFAGLPPQPPSAAVTTTVMSTADTARDVRPIAPTLAGGCHASRRLTLTSAATNTAATTAAKYTIDPSSPHGMAWYGYSHCTRMKMKAFTNGR